MKQCCRCWACRSAVEPTIISGQTNCSSRQRTDEALHYFSSDPAAVLVGKMAIAHEILAAERASSLAIKNPRREDSSLLSPFVSTWIAEFLSMALSFRQRDEYQSLFSNVTV